YVYARCAHIERNVSMSPAQGGSEVRNLTAQASASSSPLGVVVTFFPPCFVMIDFAFRPREVRHPGPYLSGSIARFWMIRGNLARYIRRIQCALMNSTSRGSSGPE